MKTWSTRNLVTAAVAAIALLGCMILDQQANAENSTSRAGALSEVGPTPRTSGIDVWEHAYYLSSRGRSGTSADR